MRRGKLMDKINIQVLRKFTEKLFLKLEIDRIKDVKIVDDYYWDIENDEKYNWKDKPAELSVGQITEDYAAISNSLLQKEVISTNDFCRLAELFRYIGTYK